MLIHHAYLIPGHNTEVQYVSIYTSAFTLTYVFQVWLGFGMNIPIYASLAILIIYYAVQSIQKIKKHLSTPNSCLQLGVRVQNGVKKVETTYCSFFMLQWNQHNNEETDYYKQWVKELLRYKR